MQYIQHQFDDTNTLLPSSDRVRLRKKIKKAEIMKFYILLFGIL